MMSDPLGTALRRLLRRASGAPGAGRSDAELLEQFVRSRDEAAIEALLWRHGPMVLATCRRLMKHHADSEDCFQATFLVLCRRAGAIAKGQSVGSWLYKVAYRICLRARAGRARRPVSAAEVGELPARETVTAFEQEELRGLLDEELNRLPKRYREPLILHYLEEKTVQQVAQDLGWRPGTVSSRLARGKEVLRLRLIRRGLTLSAASASALLAEQAASAALSAALARSTLRLLAAGVPSGPAAVLAHHYLRTQLLSRLRWALALALAVGTAAGAAVALPHDQPAPPPGPEARSFVVGEVTDPRTERERGRDPLPEGALLRFGSARFRYFDHGLAAAAYAPDGRTFTTVGQRGLVHTWGAATGRPLRTFRQAGMTPFALSADGELAAVYEPQTIHPHPRGGWIRLRRVSDQESQRLPLPPDADVFAIAISADGRRVAAGGHLRSLLVWDVTTRELIRQLPAPGWGVIGTQLQVGLSPDGKLLAALDSHPTIRLWDVETGEERRPLRIEGGRFSVFDFSRDGSVLACGDLAGRISLWGARSGQLIRCFSARPNANSGDKVEPSKHGTRAGTGVGPRPESGGPRRASEGIASLAVSSDGGLIACSCGGNLYVWDAAGQAGKRFPQVPSATGLIALAFSPDNQFLVGCDDTSQIKVWRVATGRCVLPDGAVELDRDNDPSCFAAVSPDGSMAATFSARRIRLWDTRTGRQIGEAPAGGVEGRMSRPITFSADGKYLLRPYHAIQVADVLSGKANGYTAWTACPWARPPWDKSISFPYYGGLFNDFRIVRRVATGPVPGPPRLGKSCPLALSPDEKTVAWGRYNSPSLVLRDWKSGREVSRVSCPGPCVSASFSPDGKGLAVAGESYVGTWDVSSGKQVREFAKVSNAPYEGFVWAYRPLTFSPDGRSLVAGDLDCNIRVWDAATGKTAAVLKGHAGPILSLAFFADGRRLISGSTDSTALIWDVSGLAKEHDP